MCYHLLDPPMLLRSFNMLFLNQFYFVFHKIFSILFETFCYSWGLTFLKSMLWWALGWCFLLAFINSCYKIAQCLLRDYFPKLVAQDGLNSQFIAKAELSTQEWFIFDRKLLVVKICNEVQRINRSWGDYLMSSMPI